MHCYHEIEASCDNEVNLHIKPEEEQMQKREKSNSDVATECARSEECCWRTRAFDLHTLS